MKNVLDSSYFFKNLNIERLKPVPSSAVPYVYRAQFLTLIEGNKLMVFDEENIWKEEGKYDDSWEKSCIIESSVIRIPQQILLKSLSKIFYCGC